MFNNLLFLGISGGKSGVRHWYLLSPIIFYTDLELDTSLMNTKLGILYIFSSVKLVSPVSADKSDRSSQCLCLSISSSAGAYDWVIVFDPFFHILFLMDYLWNGTKNVVYSSVSWSSIFATKFSTIHS